MKSEDELLPIFFRLAYSYKMIVEDNLVKIKNIQKMFLDKFGLKISKQQVIILLRLAIVDEISISKLATSLNIQLPNITIQVSKLQGLKLLNKQIDKSDKRVQLLRLTNRSEEILESLPLTLDMQYLGALSKLRGKRRGDVKNAFETLLDHLRAEIPDVINAVYKYN
jgi:DNA-binding MarR family transcriptional regulator